MTREIELLTPSEDLALEVLAARHRLGEAVWTFETRHKATLTRLQNRGLVTTMPGVIVKTMRASLTEKGKENVFDPDYKAPVFKTGTGEKGK